MALKRDKLDAIISDLVRERAEWTCEKCNKQFPEGSRQGLHASHLFSRGNKSTRWHPDNLFAHCFGCHHRLGSNPVDFYDWARAQLGDGCFDNLRVRAKAPRKYTKVEREEMYRHYKEQYEQMRYKRMAGVVGRIEFIAYD